MSDWKPKCTSDSVNLVGGDATMFKLLIFLVKKVLRYFQVCAFSLIKGNKVPSKKFLQAVIALTILAWQLLNSIVRTHWQKS